MYKSESIVKLAPALLKAQKAMSNAVKGSSNPFFKSAYADLNSVREAVLPALHENGFVVLQPTIEHNCKNFVETILLHESGEYISSYTEIKNMKGDAQSEGSGISYARRYGLQSITNTGAVDDDAEKTMVRVATNLIKPPAVTKVLTDTTPATQAKKAPGRPAKTQELTNSTPDREPIKTTVPPVTNGNGTKKTETIINEDEW